jgi:CRP-like cAMP-binding protein
MAIDDDIAFFERVPTLNLLGRPALRILAIGAENRYVHSGEVLFSAGEVADCGFVVQEGTLALAPQQADGGATVVVGRGTLIGELALLTETVRPVTAIAREPSTVLRIPRTLFLKMLEGYPDAAKKLRDIIASRTNSSTQEIFKVRGLLDLRASRGE